MQCAKSTKRERKYYLVNLFSLKLLKAFSLRGMTFPRVLQWLNHWLKPYGNWFNRLMTPPRPPVRIICSSLDKPQAN
jgi:hypothetical protein